MNQPFRALPLLAAALATLAPLAAARGGGAQVDGGQNHDTAAFESRIVLFQGHEAVGGEALVRFHGDVAANERSALHASLAARELRDLQRGWFHVGFEGRSVGEALEAYRSDPRVADAEPNWLRYPAYETSDPKFPNNQWGLVKVGAEDAWEVQRGDPSVVVAVIDSGVDIDHPDLADDLAWGWDFFAGDSNPDDQDGHGTHVSGIAAAETDNGLGVAGMGFGCRFAAYRCGNGSFPLSDTIASINDAVAQGAHVINMSYGSSTFSAAERDALRDAHEAGCVNVAAAGNDGWDTKHYPAAYARVLAVANTTSSDTKYSNSNYGDWVDVGAPGAAIHSTDLNGSYSNKWGTSMASPLVAGLAALLYAEIGGVRTKDNATAIRTAIEVSSVPLTFVEHGRVDALAALFELSPPAAPIITGTAPAQVDAFFGSGLTIQGTGFLSASQVEIDGTVFGTGTFTVVDDNTITLTTPSASALGSADVTVTTAGGADTSSFEYVETFPPAMLAPSFGFPGAPYTLEWAGGAHDAYLLLWSTSAATIPFLGEDLLASFEIGQIGSLDAVGYDSITLPSLGSFGFLTLYFQVLDVDELTAGFVGASPVATSLFF